MQQLEKSSTRPSLSRCATDHGKPFAGHSNQALMRSSDHDGSGASANPQATVTVVATPRTKYAAIVKRRRFIQHRSVA